LSARGLSFDDSGRKLAALFYFFMRPPLVLDKTPLTDRVLEGGFIRSSPSIGRALNKYYRNSILYKISMVIA
jgi:hypothetical protein